MIIDVLDPEELERNIIEIKDFADNLATEIEELKVKLLALEDTTERILTYIENLGSK